MLEEVQFDTVHVQAYSPRPATAAYRRSDDVPLEEKQERLQRVLALQREISARRNRALVGKRVEVLVEGVGEGGRAFGRTRQNRLAWLAPGPTAGDLLSVKVAQATAWQLQCA
jgi:tRNA-2-methylthio-N6-dimethylallyladenosine synthase